MTSPTPTPAEILSVLTVARDLIAAGWCCGTYKLEAAPHQGELSDRYCTVGALLQAADRSEENSWFYDHINTPLVRACLARLVPPNLEIDWENPPSLEYDASGTPSQEDVAYVLLTEWNDAQTTSAPVLARFDEVIAQLKNEVAK